jgi:hypothetical protein
MFAHVGVNIEWRVDQPVAFSHRSIFIELTTKTPETFQPRALAYAKPFEEAHVVVLYDRVQRVVAPSRVQHVLAHVLVHEITHIIEGTDWHSATGVMKARWNGGDYAHMERKPLDFTDADLILIRSGLNAWIPRLASDTSATLMVRRDEIAKTF